MTTLITTTGLSARRRALEYLRQSHLYRLGILPTERPHPDTRDLSHWAQQDPSKAIAVLKGIDVRAIEKLENYVSELETLAEQIHLTLARGKRIYLCGCGATGRLSLSLEFLWRQMNGHRDRVRSFMAGGDVALVHALEGFEDHPEYGARHLEEMGFEDGDLLISCTEGGETPYVIGATERAAQISSNAPYFLYCNSNGVLAKYVERFQRVYQNPKIQKLCLYVGPMALAGSTRMQASTVLQMAVGVALLHPDQIGHLIAGFGRRVRETNFAFLTNFIEREADIYAKGDFITYRVTDYGITVLTDTTERAPTFSLIPFDQLKGEQARYSLCYVSLDNASTPGESWRQLLNRPPRPLNWSEVDPRTTADYLQDFDFSARATGRRRRQIAAGTHHEFHINGTPDGLRFQLGTLSETVAVNDMPELFQHLMLKQMLNIHSTLVMGRLGRFKNNIMTWVSPTNGKLVDRATRYVKHLLVGAGRLDSQYEDIVRQLFAEMEGMEPGESVVLRTYRTLMQKSHAG